MRESTTPVPQYKLLLQAMGSVGGRARAKALSPERRQEIARHAALVRQARIRAARADDVTGEKKS
jgi:hypothetical protein